MNETDFRTELAALAPDVDMDAARALFHRRTARRRAAHRAALASAAAVAVGLVATTVLVVDDGPPVVVHADDRDAPVVESPTTIDPIAGPTASEVEFGVLAELDPNSAPSTKPYFATGQAELDWMWNVFGQPADSMPTVDWDEQIVLAVTVPGSGCRSALTRLARSGTDLVAETAAPDDGTCTRPLLLWTSVVVVDRDEVPTSFGLAVPLPEEYGYDDAFVEVQLDR
jgi:hypothetical protein